jgi:adenylate kinase
MLALLLGPPGAGKGTQAKVLADHFRVPQIATGDLLRNAVREKTKLGLDAKAAMDRGDLVPDDVILAIMKHTLAAPSAERGAILDGVVRTVPQAEGLDRVLGELGRRLEAVLVFNVSEDELVRRLSGRTVCESCQTPYMGREPGSICDRCGGTLGRRKDDEPEAVRNRLAVYQRQTAPVIAWYQNAGVRVVPINAVGSIEAVLARSLRGLET